MSEQDNKPVRLLICEDSVFMRMALKAIFEEHPEIVVVGEAKDGVEAIAAVRDLSPDIITMDVDMPGIDGMNAAETILADTDIPIIVLSGLTERRSTLANRLLDVGVVDVIWKSASLMDIDIGGIADTIVEKVIFWGSKREAGESKDEFDEIQVSSDAELSLVCVGHGAPDVFREIKGKQNRDGPPVILATDFPISCVEGFGRFLERTFEVNVEKVTEGTSLKRGSVYLFPNTTRMVVAKELGQLVFKQMPAQSFKEGWSSGSLLQASVTRCAKNADVLLLTGAAVDDRGIRAMSQHSGQVYVQAPESCVKAEGCMRAANELPKAKYISAQHVASVLGVEAP